MRYPHRDAQLEPVHLRPAALVDDTDDVDESESKEMSGPLSSAEVVRAVEAQAETVEQTLSFIHDHPELGHEERTCAAYLTDVLEERGLKVERLAAGLPTSFTAELAGGEPGPSVGVVVVYDAVPAVGPDGELRPMHACGHGPISAGVVGALLGLAEITEVLPGRVTAVGCPADEIHSPGTVAKGGGKALTAAAGLWNAFDAALYVHPEFIDTVWQSSMWMRRERLVVAGRRSLRPDTDQVVTEALASLLDSVGQQPPAKVVLESVVLDGDVEEGSGMALRADVLVIDESQEKVDTRATEVRAAVQQGSWLTLTLVPSIRADAGLTNTVQHAFEAAGRPFVLDPPPLPFATDFGAISRLVPSALIGVGHEGGWAFHTDQGAEQFASPAGLKAAKDLAGMVALSTWQVCVSAGRTGD